MIQVNDELLIKESFDLGKDSLGDFEQNWTLTNLGSVLLIFNVWLNATLSQSFGDILKIDLFIDHMTSYNCRDS